MKKILKGFSLIELLIVITIIGILAVVFLPKITSGPERARDAQRISDVTDIANAIEMFKQDNESYPDSLGAWEELTDGNTLFDGVQSNFDSNSIPQDPISTNEVLGQITTGAYYYMGDSDGFMIVTDTTTDKYSDGYVVGSALPGIITPTDSTDPTHVGENNVYVYYK